MTETSTIQSVSNLGPKEGLWFLSEESDTFDEIERLGWRIANPYTPLDSFGSQVVAHPLSPRHEFWSRRGTGEPLSRMQSIPAYAFFADIILRQPLSAQSLIERSAEEGSNFHPIWHHSYEPDPQGSRVPRMFGLHTSEARDVLVIALADIERATVREWTALVHDLTKRQDLAVGGRAQERLTTKLQVSFEDSPLEDGMGHPAEGIIAEALRPAKDQRILVWLKALCTDASRPSFAASVLRCIGRQEGVGTISWRVELVRDGLAVDNVEIRDAAVQAAESWGSSDFLQVLKSHSEPEPWLRQYILDVIQDLEE